MNKKTFTLALLFLCATSVWLAVNIRWFIVSRHCVCVFDLVVAVVLVAAAACMVYNECKKKRCRHLVEVNKHKIP